MSPPTKQGRWRLPAIVLAVIAGGAWWWWSGTAAVPALPLVDAALDRTGPVVTFRAPARSEPALVAVGTPPTPIDVAAATESDAQVIVFLYESGAPLRLVEIDKASGAQREVAIDGSELTYHPRPDRREPGVVWVPTALGAGLVRYDARDGSVRRVLVVPPETEDTHVFGFDQHDDGTLYLGTFPGARCLRVDVANGAVETEELVVSEPAVAGARYLRGIFATTDALLLYYMAPGVVVRYELETGRSAVLLQAGAGKLRFRVTGDRLLVSNDEETLHFDRQGPCAEPPEKGRRAVDVAPDGDQAGVTWDGGRATLSLRPRADGMRITSLRAGEDGAVYGGTYWNTWLFRIDPAAQTVTGLGAVPEASGEFFTTGWWREQLVIPHYQGGLYLFDPARPFSTGAGVSNPRRVDTVPGAHFGLSCVTLADDRVVYVTIPNYDQPRGMLIVRDPDGTRHVHPAIGDGLTLGNLVAIEAGLFGSTIERFGLGLRDARPERAPPQVVRLDADTGGIVESIDLGARAGRDVRDLVAGGPRTLFAVSKYDLHRVDLAPDGWRTSDVGHGRLLAGRDEMLALLPRDERTILVLTRQRLGVIDGRRVRGLCRLPIRPRLFAADGHGNVWMAAGGRLFVLPDAAVEAMLASAGGPSWAPAGD